MSYEPTQFPEPWMTVPDDPRINDLGLSNCCGERINYLGICTKCKQVAKEMELEVPF